MEQKTNYTTRIVNYALKSCGFYPLRPMQLWMIDTHFNKANSTMMNIGEFFKYDDSIDLERLAKAINETVAAHDIFRCRLVFNEGTEDLCQRFDGEIFPVKIEKLSDAEFEERKKLLKKPYRLVGNPLYRIYLFETPSGKFAYFDFYHAMFDGFSVIMLFSREFEMRYKGKKITREPLQYADFILDELRVSPEELAAGNKYWRDMLSDFDPEKHLPPADIDNSENAWKSNHMYHQFENINHSYFADRVRKEHIFFLAACMLAIAKSAGVKKSIMSWLHNGRNNAHERRLIGIMLEQYPISWNFEENITVAKFLDGVEEKVNFAPKYRRSLGTVYSEGLENDCATFIFQKGTLGANDGTVKFAGTDAQIYNSDTFANKYSAAENTLDIEINSTADGDYYFELDYDASRYSENAMKKFAETMDKIILQMQDERKMISDILN